MRVVIDGRLVELPTDAKAEEAKRAAGIPNSDSLVEISGSRAELKADGSRLSPDSRYRSIPPITQG